jgi:hypothetical protein
MNRQNQRIAKMTFAFVYPGYLTKVEKKLRFGQFVKLVGAGQFLSFFSVSGTMVRMAFLTSI